MMIIEGIKQLEKRLNELENKQKKLIERIDQLGNLEEYDKDKSYILQRQLQCTTVKKWGIIECLETLNYHFTYIDNKLKICNEFYEIMIEE